MSKCKKPDCDCIERAEQANGGEPLKHGYPCLYGNDDEKANRAKQKASEEILAKMIQAQIGTPSQSNMIENHMKEYFTRWHTYKDRFTELEWYHIFLDFLDKIPSPQPVPAPRVGEESPHTDIPAEEMRKIYKTVSVWNEEIQPWVLKGMVNGWLLAKGKLPRIHYDELKYCQLHEQHHWDSCPRCAPTTPETEQPGEVPAEVMEWIKDMAKKSTPGPGTGRELDVPHGIKNGAIAMYHRDQSTITALQKERDQLQAQLEESRNDTSIFKEWWERGQKDIAVLTEQIKAK